MNDNKIKNLKKIVLYSLDNLKTHNVVYIDVSKKSNFTDALVIGTGTSSTHIKAISDELIENLKKNGNGEFIRSETKNLAAFGSSTLAWKLSPRFSLKVQFDFHSAFYDSKLKELGDFSGQLVLGGSLILGRKLQLDVSVSEDVIVDTAPDVVFGFGVRSIF